MNLWCIVSHTILISSIKELKFSNKVSKKWKIIFHMSRTMNYYLCLFFLYAEWSKEFTPSKNTIFWILIHFSNKDAKRLHTNVWLEANASMVWLCSLANTAGMPHRPYILYIFTTNCNKVMSNVLLKYFLVTYGM